MTENIHIERSAHIAIVTIDRQERRNAFNDVMFDRLHAAARELAAAPPRAVVICGAGDKAFSAGFDVNPDNPMVLEMLAAMEKKDPEPAEKLIRRLRDAVDAFLALPVPVIAAINGLAYGGGAELAARCDLRVMDPSAEICFSEVRLGLMPDWGGGATLAHLIGPANAADLVLTARKVNADEALKLGLVNRISQPGQARDEAVALAEMIAKNGPQAVRSALDVIRQTRNLPLQGALDLEEKTAVDLIISGECMVGVAAFLEKKVPDFPDPDA